MKEVFSIPESKRKPDGPATIGFDEWTELGCPDDYKLIYIDAHGNVDLYNSKRGTEKEYCIEGIVNVSMYQSILDPAVSMSDEKYDESAWENFDPDKYAALVLERAVYELKSLLKMLTDEWHCEYVEGSAEIYANYNHNILDRLYFRVTNASGVAEKTLQDYLTAFFLPDWVDEFGAQYRIYEYIASNYTPASFPKMDYEKYEFSPTEYHTWQYKHEHRYNLQNDLLKQQNFPLYFYQTSDGKHGDFVDSFYEDRVASWSGFWTEALERLPSDFKIKAWSNMSECDLLKLLQAKYHDKNVVGFRLVRYTNVASGYPTDRLDVFGKAANTPKMEFGTNVRFNDCPEERHDMCGIHGRWGCCEYGNVYDE